MNSRGSQQETAGGATNFAAVSESSVLSTRRTTSDSGAARTSSTGETRVIARRRTLPSGRALVGGFLVALAVIGIYLAWVGASAGPATKYLVASRDLPIGTRLTAADLTAVPMELPEALASSSAFEDLSELEGVEVINPIRAGELIQGSSLVATEADGDTLEMSFAIERERAVGGRIKSGEFVDLLATFGAGADTYTVTVLQGARVLAVEAGNDALGSGGPLTVTLGVADAAEARSVAHAVDAAKITLVRSSLQADKPEQGATYRPSSGSSGD